jgi:hypothetical protein
MAVLSFDLADACAGGGPQDATAFAVWVDGRHDHEVLVFPGSGHGRYDSLVGPLAAGVHAAQLRPSAWWASSRCVSGPIVPTVSIVEAGQPRHELLRHAPLLEVRADTVGEQTDLPLFAYAEATARGGRRVLRYTEVFSNEDGGTPVRALFARWGRTTDIEQVYELELDGARPVREEFQGPDHEVRSFRGRRQGDAPILLVATMNNMVIDRGRGVAVVRPVPDVVDLAEATRESVLDGRPWACRVMAHEMEREGRVAGDAPAGEKWLQVAPHPREHVYLEARLTLDRAAVAAWVLDREGRRSWSHYGRPALAIDRSGWVRTAVPLGANPAAAVAALGWACLPVTPDTHGASCTIEATRAFVFGPDWTPGANLVAGSRFTLKPGEEGRLARVDAGK